MLLQIVSGSFVITGLCCPACTFLSGFERPCFWLPPIFPLLLVRAVGAMPVPVLREEAFVLVFPSLLSFLSHIDQDKVSTQ